jgi:hypothetical protein
MIGNELRSPVRFDRVIADKMMISVVHPVRPARFPAKGCRAHPAPTASDTSAPAARCCTVTVASASSLLPCSYGFRIVKSVRPCGALTSAWRCEIYVCAPGGSAEAAANRLGCRAPVVCVDCTNRSHRHSRNRHNQNRSPWPAVRAATPCRRRGMSLN